MIVEVDSLIVTLTVDCLVCLCVHVEGSQDRVERLLALDGVMSLLPLPKKSGNTTLQPLVILPDRSNDVYFSDL
jgi:hypothetical protein